MQRRRDESRWCVVRHDSVDSFLADSRRDGVHSIAKGRQYLDVLIEDRLSPTTLVVFNSSLTNKVSTVPVFAGRSLAQQAGLNLIAISDPSISMGDVDLAWYLGNRDIGSLRSILSPIIRHILDSLCTKKTILFGASGGGYAVGNFAHDFPGCLAIAVNPRLDMRRKPVADVAVYLKVCHRATSVTPMKRIRAQYVVEEISSLAESGLNHHFLLYQNINDSVFLNHQALPYIAALENDPNLHVRFNSDKAGHSHIPTEVIQDILTTLAEPSDELLAIRAAGFLSPRDARAWAGASLG